jgi:AcrR family transcriptional regulator
VRRRVGRPADVDSEETRRLILNSAEVVFAERGYASTSLQKIAEHAGLTGGTVYHYYRTKGELFLTVDHAANDRMLIPMEEASASQPNFARKLSAVLGVTTDVVRREPLTYHFVAVARLEARRNPEVAEAGNDTRWFQLWSNLVSTGIGTGEIDAKDGHRAAGMLAAIFVGLGQLSIELSFERFRQTVAGFEHALALYFQAARQDLP